jgi:hypothetical protein
MWIYNLGIYLPKCVAFCRQVRYNVITLATTILKEKCMTKTERLIEVLQNGEQLTARQISARFGIKNPTATVSNLRMDHGLAVYGNQHTNAKGQLTTKYRLGNPSRAVVAAGYRALSV